MLYAEKADFANKYREEQFAEINKLIQIQINQADATRTAYFKPDTASENIYVKSLESYRTDFINMLGWPLNVQHANMALPEAKIDFVDEDDLGTIYRLNITAMENITTYGLLFIPQTPGPHPLVISLHGGGGTPELCSGFFGSANYNDMTRRVLKQGIAVFAPQLYMWNDDFGPHMNRLQLDTQLKQLGGSITALEIYKLMRSIDYLASRADILADQIGMIGLSYGGFYTMFTAAADVRIKAALSSCYFNNRYMYNRQDYVWFNSASMFFDAEICQLICPRALYIEIGAKDELFHVKYGAAEIRKVQATYQKLGLSAKLKYKEFDGGHELDPSEEGIQFLVEQLRK